MEQLDMSIGMKRKRLRSEVFLSQMDGVIPWKGLLKDLEPYYKKSGGRPPHDLELMLRVYFLQQWYNLSDPGVEEAIYDRHSFRIFLGLDMFTGVIPDESSICRFRHMLEDHNLSMKLLRRVNLHLGDNGLVVKEGTIVDATIIDAPVSKKNKDRQRDPEMSSTRKNNKWHFGVKGHIGVQYKGKPIIHSVHVSTAKDSDKTHMTKLFHGEEVAVFGDSGYTHQEEKRGARVLGLYYGIADRGARDHPLSPSQKKKNQKHSSIRAKVEHPFRVIKHLWGHNKLRYKGLYKNTHHFVTLCALTNLYLCRKEPIFATG